MREECSRQIVGDVNQGFCVWMEILRRDRVRKDIIALMVLQFSVPCIRTNRVMALLHCKYFF